MYSNRFENLAILYISLDLTCGQPTLGTIQIDVEPMFTYLLDSNSDPIFGQRERLLQTRS